MLPKMVSMERTADELKKDYPMAIPGERSKYPYGLSISLGNEELEKLGLNAECEVGDFIHMFGLGEVTSISKNDTESGTTHRIEIQITHLGVEDEDGENEEVKPLKKSVKSPYK